MLTVFLLIFTQRRQFKVSKQDNRWLSSKVIENVHVKTKNGKPLNLYEKCAIFPTSAGIQLSHFSLYKSLIEWRILLVENLMHLQWKACQVCVILSRSIGLKLPAISVSECESRLALHTWANWSIGNCSKFAYFSRQLCWKNFNRPFTKCEVIIVFTFCEMEFDSEIGGTMKCCKRKLAFKRLNSFGKIDWKVAKKYHIKLISNRPKKVKNWSKMLWNWSDWSKHWSR